MKNPGVHTRIGGVQRRAQRAAAAFRSSDAAGLPTVNRLAALSEAHADTIH